MILDLLKRLESKGVPLRFHKESTGLVVLFINEEPRYFVSSEYAEQLEDEVKGHSWPIIGCVVEYMDAQGWSAVINYLKGGQAMVTFGALGGRVSTEAGDTVLEAVLEAADKALG